MSIRHSTCLCCARSLPSIGQFTMVDGKESAICVHCTMLQPEEIAVKTADTVNLIWRTKLHTTAGRKAERQSKRRAMHAQHGKRCSACHYYKPVPDYDNCTSAADGLQSCCRNCNKIHATMLPLPTGREQWRMYRAALRASAPQVQIAA